MPVTIKTADAALPKRRPETPVLRRLTEACLNSKSAWWKRERRS
ncbi:hypothetical protein ABIA99_005962 [Bradyrhizobium sp. LB12.1]